MKVSDLVSSKALFRYLRWSPKEEGQHDDVEQPQRMRDRTVGHRNYTVPPLAHRRCCIVTCGSAISVTSSTTGRPPSLTYTSIKDTHSAASQHLWRRTGSLRNVAAPVKCSREYMPVLWVLVRAQNRGIRDFSALCSVSTYE